MRNLKKILCLALVLSMVLAVVSGAAYTNYADDAELTVVNEDYLLAAQLLQDIGVVVGVKDGKLRSLTDAEIIKYTSQFWESEIFADNEVFDSYFDNFIDPL